MTHGREHGVAQAAPAASAPSNFKQRLATTLIGAPAVLLAAYVGGWVFWAVATAFALVLFFEWDRMVRGAPRDAALLVAMAGLVVALLLVAAEHWVGALVVLLLTAIASAVLSGTVGGWMAAGAAYAGLGAASVIALREQGVAELTWLLLVVWATDIGAYLAGRALGGPKLAPAISPNKTWAGFFGGILAAIAVSLLFSVSLSHPWAAGPAVTAALVALAVVLGDLLESALKRRFHTKDTGQLLPGHGGVMDRVDGLILAAVLVVGLQALGALFLPAAGVSP